MDGVVKDGSSIWIETGIKNSAEQEHDASDTMKLNGYDRLTLRKTFRSWINGHSC
jgi:hypothetical protein